MEQSLALRLDEKSPLYDSGLYRKLAKVGRDYVQAGLSVLDFYTPDFDICNDMANCWAPGIKQDFEKRDRQAPENFLHPMAATELVTLATFVSQILFGGETTRHVEPRQPDDEPKADVINELLAWNDAQQPTYNQGFFFCWDAVAFNRGVMYDFWQPLYEIEMEPVEIELPYIPQIDPATNRKIKKPKGWVGEKVIRFRKKRTKVGGFAKVQPISPYDFICDPTIPIHRFQTGRFAGHRVILPWSELKRRSELPVDDWEYVLPAVVERLKNSKGKKVSAIAAGASTTTSRSFFERQRRGQPTLTSTGSDKINKEDGGVVECWVLYVRLRPATYDIYPEDQEEEIAEFLICGDTDLLSVNITTCKHDQYPYGVGEARPNAHMQYGPSWLMIIKGCQDYVDYLKNRHKESLSRTSGNIFVGDPALIDFEAFTDPSKDGLFIPIKEAAVGKPLDQIIKQIPVTDTTSRFHDEMMLWIKTAEDSTGAHAPMQGKTEDSDQTATQFAGVQQMAAGRVSTIARLLSAGALVPQTQRIICNLQQFMPDKQIIRVTGMHDDFDPDRPPEKFLTVIRDATVFTDGEPEAQMPDIQGSFDVVVHDGSLPGTDAKKVAALSRALEAFASGNPAFADIFDATQPGSIDPKKLFYKMLKATGFPIGGLAVTREQAMQNLQSKMLAQGNGMGLPPAATPGSLTPAPAATPSSDQGLPAASTLPPTPPAQPGPPNPAAETAGITA